MKHTCQNVIVVDRRGCTEHVMCLDCGEVSEREAFPESDCPLCHEPSFFTQIENTPRTPPGHTSWRYENCDGIMALSMTEDAEL